MVKVVRGTTGASAGAAAAADGTPAETGAERLGTAETETLDSWPRDAAFTTDCILHFLKHKQTEYWRLEWPLTDSVILSLSCNLKCYEVE